MNLPYQIAKRYFFSKHKKSFISIIANISMIGVGLGTATLIVVMAVFNGLEDLNRQLFKSIDADIKIVAMKGKNFRLPKNLFQRIESIDGIEALSGVIEENALLRYRNAQTIVTVKGIDEAFLRSQMPDSAMISGSLKLSIGPYNYALLGYGVAYSLSASSQDQFTALEVWYPRKGLAISNLTGQEAFNRKNLLPAGVFSIEQSFDANHIYVPLGFARDVFEYDNKLSSIEIRLEKEANLENIQANLRQLMGSGFDVLSQDQQHASLLKAIKIEKLFVFLTLVFIIAVASFNIYFSLTMLSIEKQQDVKILKAMGANNKMIKRIFIYEGGIVAFIGTSLGLVLGLVVCWLQQSFGLISMGSSMSIFPDLPIKLKTTDVVITIVAVILITTLASYLPAKRAAKA